jgi:holo-[acyl-carrier protein] synthase
VIAGVGVDLCARARMARGLARFGERFARRVLAAPEWSDYERAPHRDAFLAKRFAAKEAFAKAFGTGVRVPATLQAIRVVRDAAGRPGFAFDARLSDALEARGITGHHLSLADERDHALAFVVLEGVAPTENGR